MNGRSDSREVHFNCKDEDLNLPFKENGRRLSLLKGHVCNGGGSWAGPGTLAHFSYQWANFYSDNNGLSTLNKFFIHLKD